MYCVLKGRAGGSRWEVGGRIDLVSCRKVIYGISGYMAPLYPETKGEGLVCVGGGHWSWAYTLRLFSYLYDGGDGSYCEVSCAS